ncbi:MAG: hypothetical protein RLZZ568_386 [Cyanobacteriota bacterium]|jgi:hypothetical protein
MVLTAIEWNLLLSVEGFPPRGKGDRLPNKRDETCNPDPNPGGGQVGVNTGGSQAVDCLVLIILEVIILKIVLIGIVAFRQFLII